MIQHINYFVRKYSSEYRMAKQGVVHKYRKANKKDNKKGQEPKRKYKAPETRRSNLLDLSIQADEESKDRNQSEQGQKTLCAYHSLGALGR